MPILGGILDNKVLGREYKRGLREGVLTILRRQIQKRFGPIQDSTEERLAARSTDELEELALRAMDARDLEDLLK